MNDQEILTYINSKDVRKYLWESGYKFSSSEAAWLVYNQEDISLENKFIAWRSIIDTMPDMEFNCYEPRFSSFHSVLLDYMTLQIENLRFLFSNTPDYYYEIVVQNRNNGKSFGSEHGYFSSYDKCYKSMIEISNPDQKKIIKKRPINQPDAPTINAEYNSKNEISALEFDADEESLLLELFFMEEIKLPLPFKNGDIVYNPFKANPLDSLAVIDDDIYSTKRIYTQKKNTLNSYNMHGYSLFPYNKGYRLDSAIFGYCSNYEYYPKNNLNGKYRIYNVLSNYIKREVSFVSFLTQYNNILFEELSNDVSAYIRSAYNIKGVST